MLKVFLIMVLVQVVMATIESFSSSNDNVYRINAMHKAKFVANS